MSANVMDADDFPYSFRWDMVRAYSVIAGVPDARLADRVDINAGFLRIMLNRHLAPILQSYLDDQVSTGDNPDDYPCPHPPDSGCPSCGPDDPCPHDCAIGIGHVTTPEWSGVIWECTVCHAIGENTPDNQATVWAEADE